MSQTDPELYDYRPGDSGPACFFSQDRICGSDCMAYLPTPPQGQAYLGEQWAHCHVLVNVDRVGRHLVVLASTASELVKHFKDEAADRKRSQPNTVKIT